VAATGTVFALVDRWGAGLDGGTDQLEHPQQALMR